MNQLPPLPSMPTMSKKISNTTYKLKDFIDKDEEYIKSSTTGSILVDYETVTNNFELLKKIISLCGIEQINCLDYESALYLERYLHEPIILSMVDDYQNIERSYIDTTSFTNHKFCIPLSYIMWNPIINDTCNVHCVRYTAGGTDTMTSMNGDKVLYKEDLIKVKEIINNINMSNLSDVDKCLLVSNYLQSKVQYVEGGLESHADKTYVIDAKLEEVTREKVGSVRTVLNENYGLCMAISNTTTLLLNNPVFNVNARSIFGSSHVWNVVTIDNKKYFIDNTWAITRNKNRIPGALKATSFSDEYMLFGTNTKEQIGYHNSACYLDGNLEKEDYSKNNLEERKKILSRTVSFTNYSQSLRFASKVI